MIDVKDLEECLECGAVVTRRAKHRRWHEDLAKVKRTAETAEAYAADAQEQLGN